MEEVTQKISIPEQIAQRLFKSLNFVGCNPTNRTFMQNIKLCIHVVNLSWWIIALILYNILICEDIPNFIEHFMYIMLIFQVMLKFFICLIFADNLTMNLQILFRRFWTDEDIIEAGKPSYLRLYYLLNLVIIAYRYLFIISIFTIGAVTMYLTPFKPVVVVWSPKSFDLNNDQPYAFISYILQIGGVGGCAIFAVSPFDSIYILLIGSAYIQFDCLISTMKYLDCTDGDYAYTTLIRCVKQHNLILIFLKKVEEVYTLVLLSQLSAILFTICMAIYTSALDENLPVRTYVYTILSVAQLLIYCVGGELITAQGLSLADAAYESSWWRLPNKSYREGLILMIQRSHKPIYISAGNIFILSIELFAKVLKASVSFITMLQTTTEE